MSSAFLGIYTTLYDYTPQSDSELALAEGDILYVLEKSEDDDWWKAKKRTLEDDEPEGLVPCNYIEPAKPIGKAKATYDYTRQTQEEISFTEDAVLDVYDTNDPDWTLVGYNEQYGFAPANYIELMEDSSSAPVAAAAGAGIAAAAAAGALAYQSNRSVSPSPQPSPGMPPPNLQKPLPTPTPEDDFDEPPPPTPPRPQSMAQESPRDRGYSSQYSPNPAAARSPKASSPPRRARFANNDSDSDSDGPSLPVKRPPNERRAQKQQAGYEPDRLHPVDVSSPTHIPPGYRSFPVQELIGKKKHAAILAVGPDRLILIPDKSTNPRQDWSIENLKTYSYEGKHVFVECAYPNKSMDLHAGSKEAAYEVWQVLAEVKGAYKSSGLQEVMSAASNKYKRSDAIGTVLWDFVAGGQDEVSVAAGDEVTILDDKDNDWWLVKRTVNGEEGVVPSNYIERGRTDIAPSIEGRSKNGDHRRGDSASLPSGVQLPVRTTSLAGKRDSRDSTGSAPAKSKPDPAKVRTWTDRSGTFKVEAQFLGCRDGKIHLHKSNGVKIAVPVMKMSMEDIEYVEKRTGMSLDEDKPLSYVKDQRAQQQQKQKAGISVTQPSTSSSSSAKKNDYDWFDFFLTCGIDLGDCQRYALNFTKQSMDETFLPELTPNSMRNLGMKEGDIIRATKFLDNKYGRSSEKKAVSFGGAETIDGEGGSLFSGPGGVLKNNTGRKARPAPAVVTSDTVDPSAFQQKVATPPPAEKPATKEVKSGFDDDPWEVKPSKQTQSAPPPKQPTPPPPAPVVQLPPPSGTLGELAGLSLNTPALQPERPPVQQPPPTTSPQPAFISPAAQQRQRPAPPQGANGAGLIAPPPQRPISAPQSQPQMPPPQITTHYTGLPPQNMSSVAPPGQKSLADQMHEMKMAEIAARQENLAQQHAVLMAQMTGARTGLIAQHTGMIPQPTGFGNLPQPTGPGMMPQFTGMPGQPGLQPAFTGMTPGMTPGMAPGMPGMPPQNVPGFLPGQNGPGLMAQPTGFGGFTQPMQPQATGINSFLQPALVPQPASQPLVPQPTGPPPPVRFGVQPGAPKIVPQPTGRRANLAQATPENPFGF